MGDFCGSNEICKEREYTVNSADGNFERCQPCGVCSEGWGLQPKCGSVVISPVKDTYCQRCHKGTYSDSYDSSPCYVCQQCAKHEIITASCTSDANTKCNGTCEHGYYYNAKDGSHACHECSYCCSDGKNEIQAECVRHGLDKRHCSQRTDVNCGPTIKTSISSNTGGLGKFKPIFILYIVIDVLVGVIILLVAVLCWRKRRNNGQNNLPGDTNTSTQQGNQHETQPMIHISGGADPQHGNESGNNNQLAQSASSGAALCPDFSRLNPGYASSNAGTSHGTPKGTPHVSPKGTPHVSPKGTPHVSPKGTPHVSPKGTLDLSRQQDGSELKTLTELKHNTQNRLDILLENSCRAVDGWREIAHRNGMDDDSVKTLETKHDPGKRVMEFLRAYKPELTVCSFCKMLKEIKRLDIVKVLEDELVSDLKK
ncbi:hypothetical protein AWC38_SpisGene14493 [Stylophora pistillata]|uniref:Tumor necrosis factor receptor superfamily member 16 n=1 Tax=Stylophora pistillata TaxID=50429 RepID=A0A2B4RW69_STYPI|nr:hypothetical protein AWC38_SpisGene14493 [Stylophora pistillata]